MSAPCPILKRIEVVGIVMLGMRLYKESVRTVVAAASVDLPECIKVA